MQANQLRMSFSAMAYVLVDSLRRVGLRHGQFADSAVATIRLKLLKLGAQVRTSVHPLRHRLGMSEQGGVRTRPSTFSAPSAPPEPQDAPKTPGLLIGMLTRALMNSHYGKPNVIARAPREPRYRQPTNPIAGSPPPARV